MIKETFEQSASCTLIAFGQTGSGKTYTVQGTEKEPGIILRAIRYIAEEFGKDDHYKAVCWMAEIYMQEINDLFKTTSNPVKSLYLEEDGTINGITLREVSNAEALKKAFDFGV